MNSIALRHGGDSAADTKRLPAQPQPMKEKHDNKMTEMAILSVNKMTKSVIFMIVK